MSLRKNIILTVLILAGLVCAYAADVTGKWTTQFDSQVGVQKYTFELKADGANLAGTAISKIADAEEVRTALTEGKINGAEITFVENLKYQGMDLRIVYKGTVSGDEIKFSRNVADQGGETFVAKRVK
jgi:hypothetical protein